MISIHGPPSVNAASGSDAIAPRVDRHLPVADEAGEGDVRAARKIDRERRRSGDRGDERDAGGVRLLDDLEARFGRSPRGDARRGARLPRARAPRRPCRPRCVGRRPRTSRHAGRRTSRATPHGIRRSARRSAAARGGPGPPPSRPRARQGPQGGAEPCGRADRRSIAVRTPRTRSSRASPVARASRSRRRREASRRGRASRQSCSRVPRRSFGRSGPRSRRRSRSR